MQRLAAAAAVAAIVLAGVPGCIHRIPGTYVCAAEGKSLVLRSDGTFRISAANRGFDGTYQLTDHTLTLKTDQGGFAGTATIVDGGIRDEEGKVWVRQ